MHIQCNDQVLAYLHRRNEIHFPLWGKANSIKYCTGEKWPWNLAWCRKHLSERIPGRQASRTLVFLLLVQFLFSNFLDSCQGSWLSPSVSKHFRFAPHLGAFAKCWLWGPQGTAKTQGAFSRTKDVAFSHPTFWKSVLTTQSVFWGLVLFCRFIFILDNWDYWSATS